MRTVESLEIPIPHMSQEQPRTVEFQAPLEHPKFWTAAISQEKTHKGPDARMPAMFPSGNNASTYR